MQNNYSAGDVVFNESSGYQHMVEDVLIQNDEIYCLVSYQDGTTKWINEKFLTPMAYRNINDSNCNTHHIFPC